MMYAFLRALLTAVLAAAALPAAQFQFGTMVRAGISGGGDWELAAGQSSGALPPNANTAYVTPHYTNGRNNDFEISYTKATNTATLTVVTRSTGPGSAITKVNWNPVGGSLVSAGALWTIPAASLYLKAATVPAATSIQISNLQLSGAINILQPIQQTTMTASQNSTPGGVLVTQSKDIVFRTNGSGDWKLTGNFTMTGLAQNASSTGAKRSELQFGFTAFAEAPEPATVLATGCGLGLLVWRARRRQQGTKVNADVISAYSIRQIERA